MAEAKGNTAVPQHGVHDRVAMVSVRADGTLDQTNPEIIGNKEFAEQATREQFRQQAVSAVDQQRAAEAKGADLPDQTIEDPEIAEARKAHEAAQASADKAADATVGALFKGDDNDPKPAAPAKSDSK